MSTDHASFYQLDRLACGRSISAAVKTHVESCKQCEQYVAKLQQPQSVPAWARQLDDGARAMPRTWWWAWAGGLASTVAIAALVLVFRSGETRLGPHDEYTTVKGSPSVGVYLKTENGVTLWNGQTPVAPGDKLRLKIVPDGYHHVAVFAESAHYKKRRYALLYEGRVSPHGELMIPAAWEVDASPGAEVIVVVMGEEPIGKSDIPRRHGGSDTQGLWSTRLVIQKSSR